MRSSQSKLGVCRVVVIVIRESADRSETTQQ